MNSEQRDQKASDIVKNHVGYAVSAGLIPIPGADLLAVTAVQLDMLRQLANLYQVNFIDNLGKNIITALVGGGAARLLSSGVKLIPGVGTLIGETTMPFLAGASTFGLGQVISKHLSGGGTLENFEPLKFKSPFKEAIRENKSAIKDAVVEQEKTDGPQDDLHTRLKKLGDLRDAGVLTEEEFAKIKEKLISKI